MNKIIACLILFCSVSILHSQTNELDTFYEKSGFFETPRYDESIEYCKLLEKSSDIVKYTTFGVSPQGRYLPLLIVDKDGNFNPEEVKKNGKLVLMIQAGIHPGEIDGKDAGFIFIRDIITGKIKANFLDHISIVFIPIFSVDGHERFGPYNRINQNGPKEMGWRTNANNLNLNRDYLKADSPEMEAWLKLFTDWLPDFFIDIHATDGADYQYASTYGLETFGNMDPGLTEFTNKSFIPEMEKYMDKATYPVFPYVQFRQWFDPQSGLKSSVGPPRLSQGYAAIQNRIGLLVENHMLKDYKTRVETTYEIIQFVCEFLNENQQKIISLNKEADEFVMSPEFKKEALALDFTASKDSVMVDFRGVEYDIEISDVTGGKWFIYHADKPITYNLPYFNDQQPTVIVNLPEAYIIPPQWTEIIEKLQWHGIEYFVLEKKEAIDIQTYKFKNIEWAGSPYEGRFRVDFEYDIIEEKQIYPAGSVIVPTKQRTARVIAHMFEPEGPDSFLKWGFFNAIFEQKEYAETYVMEPMMREMMAKDPALKAEFEKAKSENPQLSSHQWFQCNWFYQRTPYWDQKKDVYPVGRIME